MKEEELNLHNTLYDKADAIVEKEIADNAGKNASAETGSASGKKRRGYLRDGSGARKFSFGGLMLNIVVLGIVMTLVSFGASKYMTLYPYAVTANDEVVCYVDSRTSANDAMQKAISDLAEGDSKVLSVKVGDNFNIERADKIDAGEILSPDEAANAIVETVKNSNSGQEFTVVSSDTEYRTFTPDPQYERDETALAGTTIVKEESKEGKKAVTVNYTTVNGELEDQEDIETEVLDEGKSAVIVKGTLGVPEGENWETYEGSPVFRDGNELVITAQQYVGKVQYVRGGTSLATGVDCVGFVRAIYRLYGVNLSSHLSREGYRVSYADRQPGDILIFHHHVAIYIGNGKMVHAANPTQDVIVSNTRTHDLEEVRRIPRR